MSVDENKALAQRLYDEVFNRGRLARADELVAAGCVLHAAPPGTPAGPDGMRRATTLFRAAFPDSHCVIEDLIGEDDRVVARLTVSGTHRGAFRGIPPTGRSVRQEQIHVLRIVAGQIAEHWAVWDDLALLRQLGKEGQPT